MILINVILCSLWSIVAIYYKDYHLAGAWGAASVGWFVSYLNSKSPIKK